MNCAILQPSYLPWRGYFDQIRRSDVFVFYDDVQFDRHGWRNRNRVKTANGSVWLTVPVRKKGSVEQGIPINEIEIDDSNRWHRKHLATLRQAYAQAPYLDRYMPVLERHLLDPPAKLVDLTLGLTIDLARVLDLDATFMRSSEIGVSGDRTERLVGILESIGATHYLSGPSARSYLDEDQLDRAGIELEYMDYTYPEYPQLHPPFDPQVSIVDLLFTLGPSARELLRPLGDPAPERRSGDE
jgi:hypothetical protein